MSYQALLFCPDEKTAKLVTQVLSELDFSVEPSNEPFTAVKRLMAQHFDAVVVDCDNEQNATLLFKSARNSASNQSSLAVAVVEGQAGVAKAFRIGANLVLTKPINVDQAKGTLRVARGLLKKGDANKAAAPTAAPTASAPAAPTFTPAVPVQPAAPVARPQAPVQQAPAQKPAFTQAVPKAPVIPPAQPQFAQAHASAEAQESAVLDLSPDLAPSSKSAPVRPAQKEYAWQPVSKPTGPMASAFQHAAAETQEPSEIEEIVDAPETAEFAEAAFAEPVAPSAPETPSYAAPITTAGSAAAAAPAKQKVQVKAVVKPVARLAPAAPQAAAPAVKSEPKPAAPANKLVITAPPAEEAPAPVLAAPSFSAYAEPAPQKSGSKTGLIALVALLVLGAAGYFGYTKLHKGSATAPAQQTTAATSAAPTATAPTAAAPTTAAETKPSAGITTATSTPAPASHTELSTTPAKPQTEAEKKAAKPVSTGKEGEDTVETTQPEPMIVKSGTAKPKPAQPEHVDAPDPMAASAGSSEKNLAGIVTSGITVATPVQQSLRVSQGVLQGQIVKKVQPRYPTNALRMRTQGTVTIGATITKDGDVVNAKLLTGDKGLGAAALDAVREWKYKPYMLDGHPVEVQTTISVDFKLPN